MRSEKYFQSKWFEFFDGLSKLILFNVLFLLTFLFGLGIFSWNIALIILVLAMKSLEERSDSLVKTWIKNLLFHGKKAFIISIPFVLITGLFVFNTMYFYLALQEIDSIIHQILFGVFLLCTVIGVIASIHNAFVYVFFPHLSVRKHWKYSLVLLQVIPLPTMYLFASVIVGIVLVYVMPLIIIVIYPAVVIFGFYRLIRYKYRRLVADGMQSLSFDSINQQSQGGPTHT